MLGTAFTSSSHRLAVGRKVMHHRFTLFNMTILYVDYALLMIGRIKIANQLSQPPCSQIRNQLPFSVGTASDSTPAPGWLQWSPCVALARSHDQTTTETRVSGCFNVHTSSQVTTPRRPARWGSPILHQPAGQVTFCNWTPHNTSFCRQKKKKTATFGTWTFGISTPPQRQRALKIGVLCICMYKLRHELCDILVCAGYFRLLPT